MYIPYPQRFPLPHRQSLRFATASRPKRGVQGSQGSFQRQLPDLSWGGNNPTYILEASRAWIGRVHGEHG